MSNGLNSDDPDLLAAEYVLGTLDSDQRAQAHVLMGVDLGFVAMVRLWERRLGELHQMVEPVDPDAQLWERIRKRVNAIAQNPVEKPQTPATPAGTTAAADKQQPIVPAVEATTVPSAEPPQPVVQEGRVEAPKVEVVKPAEAVVVEPRQSPVAAVVTSANGGPGAWRAVAIVMSIAVVVLGFLNLAWFLFPDKLPDALRPPFALTSTAAAPTPQQSAPPQRQRGPAFEE
jgi:anti-sigma-K factor RskA